MTMKLITNPDVIEIAQWLEDNPEWKKVIREVLDLPQDLRHQFITTFLEKREAAAE